MSAVMLRRIGRLTAVAVIGLALGLIGGANEAAAQRIGIEGGLTHVEDFDGLRPTLGGSLSFGLTQRLRLTGTATQWTGCPEGGCDEPRDGAGNRAFNLLGMFDVFETPRLDVALGAGMGWYEMRRPRSGEGGSERYYDEAITFAVQIRREIAYNSGMYLRGETSLPIDDGGARSTSLRLGVDVRPF